MQNRIILQAIKSELLDLWIRESSESITEYECYELLKKFMFREFGILKVEFLYCDQDVFYPSSSKATSKKQGEIISLAEISPNLQQNNFVIEKLKERIPYCEEAIVFYGIDGHLIGMLVFEKTEQWITFANTQHINELSQLFTQTLHKVISINKRNRQLILNGKISKLKEDLHSSMDVDYILETLIREVEKIFPQFEAQLILSNDQGRKSKVDIKLFDYMSERQSAIESFVSGEVTTEKLYETQEKILNAPLKGLQGIYGLLEISMVLDYRLSDGEKEMFELLGQTAGIALENAKLYHQSHRLISDLQLINDTSHHLNMEITKSEMLAFLSKQLEDAFLPSQIGFALKKGRSFEFTATSASYFDQFEANVYVNYIEDIFSVSKEPIFIADFSEMISREKLRYLSLIAIPIIIREKVFGYCLILHKDSYYFSFDNYKLMQSLIRHSTLAISNILLREQLQEMVNRDHLTKLYARKFLDCFLEDSFRNDESGVFVLFDIDNFKMVNDTFGHQKGDRILVGISNILQRNVGDKGICARWGGEELAVYFPNSNLKQVLQIIKNIIKEIPLEMKPSVTVSAGISTWTTSQNQTFQDIFQAADLALYDAKRNGKNQYCLFETPQYSEEKVEEY